MVSPEAACNAVSTDLLSFKATRWLVCTDAQQCMRTYCVPEGPLFLEPPLAKYAYILCIYTSYVICTNVYGMEFRFVCFVAEWCGQGLCFLSQEVASI